MSDIAPLILDLLEWLDKEPRPYLDVMEAWRTSCPRLPVWEESVDRGFVVRERMAGRDAIVQVTREGREFLLRNRPQPLAQSGAIGAAPIHSARGNPHVDAPIRELIGA